MTLSPFLGQTFSRKGYVLVPSPALFCDPSQRFPCSRLSKYIVNNLVVLGHMVLRAVVLCEMVIAEKLAAPSPVPTVRAHFIQSPV